MYESIRIQNFRGLKDLTIENLGRVNLLVGANNVGKTSVLEALYVLGNPGDPTASLKLASARGVETSARNAEEVWLDLFTDALQPAQLYSQLAIGRPIWVDISLHRPNDADASQLAFQSNGVGLPELGPRIAAPRSLILMTTMRREGVEDEVSTAFVDTTGTLSGRVFESPSWPRTVLVSATGVISETEVAGELSQAEEQELVALLVQDLESLVPELLDLRVALRRSDGKAFIRAHLRDGQKRPLYLFGSGTVRLTALLLSAINNRAGAVLVDEVESGVHYSRLQRTWESLGAAARRSGMRIVATTHSWECVEAAIRAFDGDHADDFRLIRLEQDGDDVRAVTAKHNQVESAVALGFDVR